MKSILATISIVLLTFSFAYSQNISKRNTISLDGNWQIAEGSMDTIPKRFDHTVPVPGLVSFSIPAFKNVGPTVKDRRSISQSDPLREAFWYRSTFRVSSTIPEVAILKVSKAMFGTKVFLNGVDLGEHLPCFTPGYFDAKNAVKEGLNEILIRVGSSPDAVPASIPRGFDFEKEHYIPGIFDDVELILSGTPHIVRVQTVPDIFNKQVRLQIDLQNSGEAKASELTFYIKESKSQKLAGTFKKEIKLSSSGKDTLVYVTIPLKGCHLWSPEDPFLYDLEVSTETDTYTTRFGMREFHFDPVTKKAVLNGKPYFLRGSNITLYRFFEDSACKNLPWDSTWVRNLHKSFKKFHWNSLRYCIGLAPDEWYRIADEEGFLIQDEFPVWYGGIGWNVWPKELKSDELAKEYSEWMRDSWNHPSIVIWDASNETVCDNGETDETGKAVWKVRNLDLSNRPWDNSYSTHRAPGDVFESHPYHFHNPDFRLKDIAKASAIPEGNQYKNHESFPVIINEYGWLWLNRDGTPTTLTEQLYKNLLGDHSTTLQRRHLYAMYTAAETEFWRCHRNAAGVLHFTALGYSRSDGQTSDNFIDPAKLEYESEFLKYVPDAFSPVGIMLDEWGKEIETGKQHGFNIIAINDLEPVWSGEVHLQILKEGKIILDKSSPLTIPPYGKKAISIICNSPEKAGLYTVQAVLEKRGEKHVKSVREIVFK
ncbi:MAG TPA: glycoside hydrolase family 2 TIM barrel-domain containing protein [Hanamia sp.]|nr:glycoside hydrolase family 2 TIM barrel-domain containing protein [Hanamia sp.]